MGFREIFLKRIAEKTAMSKPVYKEVDPDKLQAFRSRDIETSIQLYLHLKNLGLSFDDLIEYVEKQREVARGTPRSMLKETLTQTRAERKRLAGLTPEGQRRRQKNGR